MARAAQRTTQGGEPRREASTPAPLAVLGVDRLVATAARAIQPLAALTPLATGGAMAERERLVREVVAGRRPRPRWTYIPRDDVALRHALDRAQRALSGYEDDPLVAVYLERLQELSLEAALCAAAGTARVESLARERFAPRGPDAPRQADAMCDAWLSEARAPEPDDAERVLSDDPSPGSLLSQMTAAAARMRLPFAVIAVAALTPLAATGDGVILVAAGRPLCRDDAARTVVHEIEGHAVPRARSIGAPLAVFGAATARGVDDQEGLALLFEQRTNLLGPRRRTELAARHRAVQAMNEGADFAEVTGLLFLTHGLAARSAVVIAERVFRGSDGARPGLGRERVYLESLARVRSHLAAHPADEVVLRSGQISVDAVATLRPLVEAGW